MDVAINPRSGVGPEFEKGDRRLRPSLRQRPAQRGARRDAQPPHARRLRPFSRNVRVPSIPESPNPELREKMDFGDAAPSRPLLRGQTAAREAAMCASAATKPL